MMRGKRNQKKIKLRISGEKREEKERERWLMKDGGWRKGLMSYLMGKGFYIKQKQRQQVNIAKSYTTSMTYGSTSIRTLFLSLYFTSAPFSFFFFNFILYSLSHSTLLSILSFFVQSHFIITIILFYLKLDLLKKYSLNIKINKKTLGQQKKYGEVIMKRKINPQ